METSSYEYLGTLSQSPSITSYAAGTGERDHLFLINRIAHSDSSKYLFRELAAFSQNRPEYSEFIELFHDGRAFCAVFDYKQAPSLAERFPNGTGNLSSRLKALSAALYKINMALSMPLPVVCSILLPENILIDETDKICLRYRILPEFLSINEPEKIWDGLEELMVFLFEKELKSFRFRAIQNIRAKCHAHLYTSLSEMMKEVEKAQLRIAETDFSYLMKQKFMRQKERLKKAAGVSSFLLLLFVGIYLISLFTQPAAISTTANNTIGTITYAAGQQDKEKNLELMDKLPAQTTAEPDFSAITPELKLDFEDYVIRPRDTLKAVCLKTYGSAAYQNPVAAFNGQSVDDPLVPGSILRLPLKSQLADYLK